MSLIRQMIIILSLVFLLEGCIFVAGAAAGAAAIAVVYDHQTIEKRLNDAKISNKIVDKFKHYSNLRYESHINVTVFHHIVLLTGQTPKAAWKLKAGEIAQMTPGATRVYNQIAVQGPTSALTRTSDSWITTKVKASMLATRDLASGNIKVLTENGVVYLIGVLTHQQAETAVEIARQETGVQRVVKIFQYTD